MMMVAMAMSVMVITTVAHDVNANAILCMEFHFQILHTNVLIEIYVKLQKRTPLQNE